MAHAAIVCGSLQCVAACSAAVCCSVWCCIVLLCRRSVSWLVANTSLESVCHHLCMKQGRCSESELLCRFVGVCCTVLWRVRVVLWVRGSVEVCCTVVHCVALCCTLLHCVVASQSCSVVPWIRGSMLHCGALCCAVLHCVVASQSCSVGSWEYAELCSVCCSVLWRASVSCSCCSVLQ